jgi:hypothetical protein
MAQNVSQQIMITVLLGMIATKTPDWRDTVEQFRMLSEWAIKNFEWEGDQAEAEEIRSGALAHLQEGLSVLHQALLRAEENQPPPV